MTVRDDWSGAFALLDTPPPDLPLLEIADAARTLYGLSGRVTRLSGERDLNLLFDDPATGRRAVLKAINPQERPEETDLQLQLLDHLATRDRGLGLPRPIRTRSGEALAVFAAAGGVFRLRAYSYVAGRPALGIAPDPALRHSAGRAAGLVAAALADFRHPAADRPFLWSVMALPALAPLAATLEGDPDVAALSEVFAAFAGPLAPALAALPRQAIHNDLSGSNLLVDPQRPAEVTGVVDFGDLVVAPRVAELAVAASYLLGGAPADPLDALAAVAAGFQQACPLTDQERGHLLDLVLARVALRVVVPAWRARRFPENSDYILRSNGEARRLMADLLPLWRQADRAMLARRFRPRP